MAVANPDFAAMFVDNLFDDCQTETGALALGGEIRFKSAGEQFGRKTAAVVAEKQTGMTGIQARCGNFKPRRGRHL